MSGNAANRDRSNQRGDILAAYRLLSEIERLKSTKDAAEKQLNALTETLRLLVSSFPIDERNAFIRQLSEAGISNEVRRSTAEYHNNVVSIFRTAPLLEWSIPDIKKALHEHGTDINDKSLYNIINYLATTGRLQRVSRGRYVIKGLGAGLDIDNVRNDGTMRATEHDA